MTGERPGPEALPRITAEVAREFLAQGRLAVPPDEPESPEDERAFWDEVERRFRERYGRDP